MLVLLMKFKNKTRNKQINIARNSLMQCVLADTKKGPLN